MGFFGEGVQIIFRGGGVSEEDGLDEGMGCCSKWMISGLILVKGRVWGRCVSAEEGGMEVLVKMVKLVVFVGIVA